MKEECHAKCGLFCPSCIAYIATHSHPERLDAVAQMFRLSRDDVICDGCGSSRVSYYCRTCAIKSCAQQKGLISSCAECEQVPCGKITDFHASGRPHRLEVLSSLQYWEQNGFESWARRQEADYRCSECGALCSAYSLKCPVCGHEPGNAFVGRNKERIEAFLSGRSGT